MAQLFSSSYFHFFVSAVAADTRRDTGAIHRPDERPALLGAQLADVPRGRIRNLKFMKGEYADPVSFDGGFRYLTTGRPSRKKKKKTRNIKSYHYLSGLIIHDSMKVVRDSFFFERTTFPQPLLFPCSFFVISSRG